ncbi:putative cytochrome P450 [Rosellinia necatrix]|uniref:Putative cytochrome P450 n=1 Tax=Rosellinia necatrix TaxID=77044 RepID=A0A1S8A9S8_ROSNE|nr:putative cytochrome P450 [Rosellinia necatrix]
MEAHNASSFQPNAAYDKLNTILGTDVSTFLTTFGAWQGVILLLCLSWGASSLSTSRRIRVAGAPVHGYMSWLEPTWFFKLRYAKDAHKTIVSGYHKFKESPFVLRRLDHDITILPTKYINELRSIPTAKLSRGRANFLEWGDQWAMHTLWSHSEWSIRAISENRNGQMGKYLEAIRKELDYAYKAEMPQVDDWTKVDIQHIIGKILVRIIGKMIVGNPACRSDEWLNLGFTEDFVSASILMRLLPTWTHPIITNILPQRWKMRKGVKTVSKIIEPAIARHRDANQKRSQGLDVNEEDSMLNWVLDNADSDDVLENLPKIVLVMFVPAAHTTSMAISNVLFDLCAHPEWDAKLHSEVTNLIKEVGPVGEKLPVKDWTARLEFLDSFFNESQRLSQPISITPNRYAYENVTFKDGLTIPKGALVGFVAIHNQIDPEIAPNPEKFDPMRSFVRRHSSPEEKDKHLAGQPSKENFAFGYGGQACPGRNYAVAVLKMVLSRILVDYEFKFVAGHTKPTKYHLMEFIIPDPTAKLMMRKRKSA